MRFLYSGVHTKAYEPRSSSETFSSAIDIDWTAQDHGTATHLPSYHPPSVSFHWGLLVLYMSMNSVSATGNSAGSSSSNPVAVANRCRSVGSVMITSYVPRGELA